jgi:hypothetical protein
MTFVGSLLHTSLAKCCHGCNWALVSDDADGIVDFIDNVLFPLCSKLEVVIRFISRVSIMKEQEIEDGSAACVEYVQLYRDLLHVGFKHPLLGVTPSVLPKMHILEVHAPEFARAWGSIGFFGEDVIETVHKDVNESERRYCNVRNTELRMSVREDFRAIKFEQAVLDMK